jgi:hypothetical protein
MAVHRVLKVNSLSGLPKQISLQNMIEQVVLYSICKRQHSLENWDHAGVDKAVFINQMYSVLANQHGDENTEIYGDQYISYKNHT